MMLLRIDLLGLIHKYHIVNNYLMADTTEESASSVVAPAAVSEAVAAAAAAIASVVVTVDANASAAAQASATNDDNRNSGNNNTNSVRVNVIIDSNNSGATSGSNDGNSSAASSSRGAAAHAIVESSKKKNKKKPKRVASTTQMLTGIDNSNMNYQQHIDSDDEENDNEANEVDNELDPGVVDVQHVSSPSKSSGKKRGSRRKAPLSSASSSPNRSYGSTKLPAEFPPIIVSTLSLPEPPSRDPLTIVDSEQFQALVEEVRQAIRAGIQPQRIAQGSSGSYFVKNRDGRIVGVFKPKNEEPYGHLNPKWTKWLHKTCCPCFFGRSCLIPNSGYTSEAGASLVDRKLGLNIVPWTEIVELASPAFHYGLIDRQHARRHGGEYPLKIGSFQLFVNGYKDAAFFMRQFQDYPMAPSTQREFQRWFERLVILDYIIRNTDRGIDNWLIKFQEASFREEIRHDSRADAVVTPHATAASSIESANVVTNSVDNTATSSVNPTPSEHHDIGHDWSLVEPPHVYIAAIDHGLAFPFKHPDQWRSYPFGWATLAASQVPFSQITRDEFLPKLTDPLFTQELVAELRAIFRHDRDFDDKLFRRQMAVLRGQIYNLIDALHHGLRPIDLVNLPVLAIYEDEESGRNRFETFSGSKPCFSWF